MHVIVSAVSHALGFLSREWPVVGEICDRIAVSKGARICKIITLLNNSRVS
jgi:hypothetical protein